MPAYKPVPERAEAREVRAIEDDEKRRGEIEEDNGDRDGEGSEDDFYIVPSLETCEIKSIQKLTASSLKEDMHPPPVKEKQISVDPLSLKQLAKAEGHVPSAPVLSAGVKMQALILPSLSKPKFISSSLPCSTTSSPQSHVKSIKKWQDLTQKPHPARHSLAHQSSMVLSHSALHQGMQLRRSKSCGEGRSCAPSDEFDILSTRPSIHVPRNGVQVLYECSDDAADSVKDQDELDAQGEESFKCGALCLFLPGLSKKKQVPSSKEEREEQGSVVSRSVSLEKFECGSWSSAAIIDGDEEDDGGLQSYFDLPLELIRCSTNDANSPVKTAFVFESDRKGVLKKSSSKLTPRKLHESSNRHVRFSTSAPTSYPSSPTSSCITPRLRKAREEFNAFLEAQNA